MKTEDSTKERGFVARAIYSLLHSVSWLCNLTMILLFLLSILSRVLSPNVFLFPAFLGLSFPFLLLGMILFTLYRMIKGSWKGFFFNLAILVASYSIISAYVPLNSKEKDIPTEAIKLISLNCKGFSFIQHTAKKPNPTLQYIKESKADIVCLQETYVMRARKNYVSLRTIKDYLKKEYPYVRLDFAQNKKGSGLMLLSKYPILSHRTLNIKSHYNGGAAYTLDIKGKKVLLYNLHLESFKLKVKDKNRYTYLVREGKPIELGNQLVHKLGPAFRIRSRQADKIFLDYSRQDIPYIIICGDFNDTPISYTYRRISTDLEDAFISSGLGFGYSFSLKFFSIRIDHILHSSNISSYNCRVEKDINISDHKPISSYLYLED